MKGKLKLQYHGLPIDFETMYDSEHISKEQLDIDISVGGKLGYGDALHTVEHYWTIVLTVTEQDKDLFGHNNNPRLGFRVRSDRDRMFKTLQNMNDPIVTLNIKDWYMWMDNLDDIRHDRWINNRFKARCHYKILNGMFKNYQFSIRDGSAGHLIYYEPSWLDRILGLRKMIINNIHHAVSSQSRTTTTATTTQRT